MEHCCEKMIRILEDGRSALCYTAIFRQFMIMDRSEESSAGYRISFCPWCGKQFPPSLRDTWFERAEAMGLEDGISLIWDKDPRIPPEMFSDEWWKKDGL